jgi:hypothetical protein
MADPGSGTESTAGSPRNADGPDAGTDGLPPFLSIERDPPGLLERVLRRKPATHAFVELNNLFAGAGDPSAITEEDVEQICRGYGFDVRRTFAARCQKLYRDYLSWCLTDRRLTDDELANLAHLATLLRLDATTAAAIQHAVTRNVYLRSVEEVLADGETSDEERAFLQRLSEQLRIPAGTAANIYDVRRRQMEQRKQRPD